MELRAPRKDWLGVAHFRGKEGVVEPLRHERQEVAVHAARSLVERLTGVLEVGDGLLDRHERTLPGASGPCVGSGKTKAPFL